jgi:phosphoribosylformylglycinamidine synthase
MSTETKTEAKIYHFIVSPRRADDPRSAGLLHDAHALGLQAVESLRCQDLYFIEGFVMQPDLQRLAHELLSDPITQDVTWDSQASSKPLSSNSDKGAHLIDVALRPGVTDSVAEQIVRAAGVLGIRGVGRASSGQRYVVCGERLSSEDLHLLARRLLANPTIQRYALGEIEPVFPHPAQASASVETIPIRLLSDEGLLSLSRTRLAALDLCEMGAIQDYYRQQARDSTDVEFETIAQTWSEHCVHKTFKARIAIGEEYIDGLLRTYIRAATERIAAPWVLSSFQDNAGIIIFDDEFEVSFKVETHNHPSAIEPFGGANTGIGGVIRDSGCLCQAIAATDVCLVHWMHPAGYQPVFCPFASSRVVAGIGIQQQNWHPHCQQRSLNSFIGQPAGLLRVRRHHTAGSPRAPPVR